LIAHIALVVFINSQPQIHGADQRVGIARARLIAGELLQNEPRIRLIGVERTNNVIAVAPRLGTVSILLVAVRFGVAHQVEPVPGPLFSVMRAGQQAIDQPLVCIGPILD